jgi:hypothetical protein
LDIKLEGADIVLIANAHNPSIVTHQWLQNNKLIKEEPQNFTHTPGFSIFESENLFLTVDYQRLQIAAKNYNEEIINSLNNFVVGYIELLPQIPYVALGLNFMWKAIFTEDEKLPEINIVINDKKINSLLDKTETKCGGIIYMKKFPYVLKIVFEPVHDNIILFNFNFHHEIKDKAIKEILDYVNSFINRKAESLEIIEKFFN